MKKTVLLAFLCVAFLTKGFAQDYEHSIKINPLGAIFGAANLAYEKTLSENTSVLIAPSFGMLKLSGFKYTTYGLGAEYRFYISKNHVAPEGMYVAPGAGFSFGQAKYEDDHDKTKTTGFNIKGVLGYQWIWESGFTLDLNGGIQYTSFSFRDDEFDAIPFSGILPALGVSIGYSF